MTSTMMRPTAGLNAASTGRNAGSAPQLPSRAAFARGTVRVPRQAGPQLQQSISTICKASNEKTGAPAVAEAIGLPTEEGLFGFKPFPELWVGRLAMMGFLTSAVEEGITGRGTLGQIGLATPNYALLCTLAIGATVATMVGVGNTIKNARTGQLSLSDLARYKSFLGMRGEESAIAESRFSSPADAVLGDKPALDQNQAGQAAPASEDDLPATSAPAVEPVDDWAYAKKVELTQGRWAMLGFLSAIIMEAATGDGILGQLLDYAKWTGLLGSESGF